MRKKRASGGKRAGDKRRAERAAAKARALQGRDVVAEWSAKLADLGPRPSKADDAHAWLGRAALLLVEATMRDTAIPPEQMRRDAMKQIEQASKVLDPAKLSEQLAELERALAELETRHAGALEAGTRRETAAPAALS